MHYDEGVTAVIRSLGGGGAERVLTTMLNWWVEHGISASVITTTLADSHAYKLDRRIRCITIPPIQESNLDNCPWNVRHLRQAIDMEHHRICLSFMEKSNIPCVLATAGLDVRLICAERTDPRMQHLYTDYKKALIRKLYPLADALVVQTENVRRGWASTFMPDEKTVVINNMVSVDTSIMHSIPLPDKFICCMGRLSPSKGFAGLFSVLPKIFASHPDQSLVLLGEGPDRQSLMAQIAALGLSDKVFLPGFLHAPHSILQQADLFIFPSLFEGFPNALIEAMSVGITPVSFDCPSGPSEIIRQGETGFLIPVNDFDNLAETVIELLDDSAKRMQIAKNAKAWAAQAYNLERIMSHWEALRLKLLATSCTVFPRADVPEVSFSLT